MGRLSNWYPRVVYPTTVLLFGGLVLANVTAWAWAFALFADRPAMMAIALVAWVFGLRHAVDADHIAAIDNVVRKLMQGGGTPKTAGFYFALGHSTVVVVATLLLAVGAVRFGGAGLLAGAGGMIGPSVSAAFLFLIACLNFAILMDLWRVFREVRAHRPHDAGRIDALLARRGVLARLLVPMFRLVTKSWHMYPLGLLFALGFDTATEVGLLSISATEAARGIALSHVLVFPALFAVGMAIADTADSALMVSAYRWAFVDPSRKLWYNLAITGGSVVVALFVGGVEALGLIGRRLGFQGKIWSLAEGMNASLANFGFMVIALFAIAWLFSVVSYRVHLSAHRSRTVACTDGGSFGNSRRRASGFSRMWKRENCG